MANNKPKIKPVTLTDLAAESVLVVQEVKAADTPKARKLTAKDFLALAIRNAGTTLDRVQHRRGVIYEPQTPKWFETQGFIRRSMVTIRSPNWPGPPSELRRLNFLLTAEALTEIVGLGSSTLEIYAVAVLICTEQHPESFGECTNLTQHEKRLVDLGLKRDELFARIGAEYTADDILTSKPDGQQRVTQTFAISNGAVSVHPVESAGERLVNYLLTREAEQLAV